MVYVSVPLPRNSNQQDSFLLFVLFEENIETPLAGQSFTGYASAFHFVVSVAAPILKTWHPR